MRNKEGTEDQVATLALIRHRELLRIINLHCFKKIKITISAYAGYLTTVNNPASDDILKLRGQPCLTPSHQRNASKAAFSFFAALHKPMYGSMNPLIYVFPVGKYFPSVKGNSGGYTMEDRRRIRPLKKDRVFKLLPV